MSRGPVPAGRRAPGGGEFERSGKHHSRAQSTSPRRAEVVAPLRGGRAGVCCCGKAPRVGGRDQAEAMLQPR